VVEFVVRAHVENLETVVRVLSDSNLLGTVFGKAALSRPVRVVADIRLDLPIMEEIVVSTNVEDFDAAIMVLRRGNLLGAVLGKSSLARPVNVVADTRLDLPIVEEIVVSTNVEDFETTASKILCDSDLLSAIFRKARFTKPIPMENRHDLSSGNENSAKSTSRGNEVSKSTIHSGTRTSYF